MIVKVICCFIASINGGFMKDSNVNSICNFFTKASKIVTYTNIGKTEYTKGNDKFEALLLALENITNDSHDMPAYGVSLDNEVINATKKGTWIELVFDTTQKYKEMPFDALLINVESESSGFNLIRKHNNKYDGRCFYLNLKENMKELFEVINNISK